VFYDELNGRLLARNRGISDARFLSSFGIGQISNVVSPLRRLGLPAAAVIDLDFLTHHDNEWNHLSRASRIPQRDWSTLIEKERRILEIFSGKDCESETQNRGDLVAVPEENLGETKSYLSVLNKYGIFFVEVSELEGLAGKAWSSN
jgi:hypothetical protein